jgi:hypothetical protein
MSVEILSAERQYQISLAPPGEGLGYADEGYTPKRPTPTGVRIFRPTTRVGIFFPDERKMENSGPNFPPAPRTGCGGVRGAANMYLVNHPLS